MRTPTWLLAGTFLGLSAAAVGAVTKATDSRWLTGADETTRVERLEHYLGGFSSAMLETGLRFEHVRQAVRDGNLELAHYHWCGGAGFLGHGFPVRNCDQGGGRHERREQA